MSGIFEELTKPGFSISQDDLGKTKRLLGLGVAYLGLVLTKTDQDKRPRS
jgi:hypothetical protein